MPTGRPTKILAIASGGGHWIQLLRLRPAFLGADITYASVSTALAADVGGHRFYCFPDANRQQKLALLRQVFKIGWILLRVRPDVIISTGASCGYVAIRIGQLLGARTLFIDSIANAESLSLSGHMARRHAGLTLTQWPHLASSEGPKYEGSVL
jgi:UDP-N-acetylglucosamine:LPS N-acetylglucosamine transferase